MGWGEIGVRGVFECVLRGGCVESMARTFRNDPPLQAENTGVQ
jgi:hypothetical protein